MKTYLDGKSILITGDVMNQVIPSIVGYYGNVLKSDYCQLPHHGLYAGSEDLWDCVDPSIVFINTHKTAAEERLNETLSENHSSLKYLMTEKNVEEAYAADDGWTVVVLSYTGPEFEENADYNTEKDSVAWEDFIA